MQEEKVLKLINTILEDNNMSLKIVQQIAVVTNPVEKVEAEKIEETKND